MQRWSRTLLVTVIVALATIGTVTGGTLAVPASPSTGEVPDAIENDALALQTDAVDADLESGESFWQGWQLGVDASGIVEGDDRDLEVWRVTEDGQLSQRVATVTADESGQAVVETNRLNARYVLRYNDDPVYVQQGQAYLDSPPDGSAVTVETSTFSVVRQELAVEWSDPEVYPGQGTVLTASTNRDRSVVAVSGQGLSFEELTTLVPDSVYASEHDARAENDQLLVEVTPGSRFRLNTSVLTPGTQEFTFHVVDTRAQARVSLTVNEASSDRRFASVEWHETVGDVLVVELACSNCYLAVGTPETGTLDLLELTDGNGDGRITLFMNTRYAGQYIGASGYPDNVRAYTSPDDDVRRYSSGTKLEQVDEELSYTIDTLGKLRDQLGLVATGRDRPIGPGPVQLTVARTDFLINRSAYGDRAPYGSNLVIRDETDARTVELEPRSFDGMHSMAAPGGSGFDPTADALRTAAGPRDRVALGDRLVFRIDLSGVYGYLDAQGATMETFLENEEGLDLSLVEGGAEERVALDRLDVRVVPDPSSNALYVVFKTGTGRLGHLETGQYRLTFTLHGVSGETDAYSIREAHDGYPYLAPGARESASASVTIEPPTASITAPESGSSPELTANGELVVSGTATVAGGTALRVHAESTEFAWETSVRVTADQAGDWRATLDLSDAPGETFSVAVSKDDQVLDEEIFTVQLSVGGESDGGQDGNNGGGDGGDGGGGDGGEGGPSDGSGSLIPGGSLTILGIAFLAAVFLLVVWRVVG